MYHAPFLLTGMTAPDILCYVTLGHPVHRHGAQGWPFTPMAQARLSTATRSHLLLVFLDARTSCPSRGNAL